MVAGNLNDLGDVRSIIFSAARSDRRDLYGYGEFHSKSNNFIGLMNFELGCVYVGTVTRESSNDKSIAKITVTQF